MAGRKSLEGLFPGMENLKIGESSSAAASSKSKKSSMKGTFSGSFSSKGWPSGWNSIRGNRKPVAFTIRVSDRLRAQAGTQTAGDVEERIKAIRALSQGGFSARKNDAFYEVLEEDMMMAIFGSNYLEEVGSPYDITIKLCRAVFRAQDVQVEIPSKDPEYAAAQQHLRDTLKKPRADGAAVSRSRKEVVQHAKAINHLISGFSIGEESLSEELIKDTHRILHDGIPTESEPGTYREHKIGAKYATMKKPTVFIDHRAVGRYMGDLVRDFEAEVTEAEESKTLDPYVLAARYCHKFINTHPFEDGNGRMSRMLMNAVLLKYAGHVVAFGESGDSDRDEYMELAIRASKKFREEDMEAGEHTGHVELGSFVLKRSVRGLNKLLGKQRACNNSREQATIEVNIKRFVAGAEVA
ncbi:MAG: hypothetical protein M1831_000502 [Alyxoria varia]|nr:MAG: hypothetical protein M1831_000502 [Alyxoria varia]